MFWSGDQKHNYYVFGLAGYSATGFSIVYLHTILICTPIFCDFFLRSDWASATEYIYDNSVVKDALNSWFL